MAGDESSDVDSDNSASNDDGDTPFTPRKRKLDAREPQHGLIVQTAFDAYFTQSASRAPTSTNVFSSLVPPLSAEEYSDAIESAAARPGLPPILPSLLSEPERSLLFSRFLRELAEGFNILVYGFGSKQRVLNHFAAEYCAKAGTVVVANGFHPDFTLKDLLNSIENIPGVASLDLPPTTVENQAKRISDLFAHHPPRTANGRLYIIIHNIDSAPLRSQKAKSCLALLALTPRIHIVASVDHIAAPLLWSTSEASARKHEHPATRARGFAWLWHDLTTLAPYDAELAYADHTSLAGAHGGGARNTGTAHDEAVGTGMTETAALHILASVTHKAKKLFVLVGARQLAGVEEVEAGAEDAGAGGQDLQRFAVGYDALFTAARDNFIATSDTSLRALLGEFRDHGLVVSAQAAAGGGGEVLWIPLRKGRLANVLRSIQTDQ